MACLEASKLRHFVKMNDEWCDGEGGPADRRHDRRKCKSHARNSQKKIYVTSFGTQPPIGLLVHPQAHKPTACALSTPAWSYRTNHAQSTSSSISAGASNPYARPCPHGPTRPARLVRDQHRRVGVCSEQAFIALDHRRVHIIHWRIFRRWHHRGAEHVPRAPECGPAVCVRCVLCTVGPSGTQSPLTTAARATLLRTLRSSSCSGRTSKTLRGSAAQRRSLCSCASTCSCTGSARVPPPPPCLGTAARESA